MLYINDEPLRKGTPQWDKFEEFRTQELPTLKNPVIIKSAEPIRFNETGLPEPRKRRTLPLFYTIGSDFGSETWNYCERPPQKMNTGKMRYFNKSKIMRDKWSFDVNKHADLLFFLFKISPYFDKGWIILEDRRRDARKEISKEAGELDVKFMIISEHSPISPEQTGSEDMMRMIASAWGIIDADNPEKSIEEIKLDLLATVKNSQQMYGKTQRGYKEFLREIDAKNLLIIRANIQRAIDKGVIRYDDLTFSWRFMATNNIIMAVSANMTTEPQKALYNFMVKNAKAMKALEGVLENAFSISEEPEEEERLSMKENPYDSLENASIQELKMHAKKEGINTFGMKKVDIVDAIKKLSHV